MKKMMPGQSSGGGTSQKPGEVKQIGTIDFADKRAVQKQLAQAQIDFAGLDYEMNCTVTADGKVWRVTGTSGQVNPWSIEQMGSSLTGAYSYHNHPADKTWYSFSADDVRFFFASGADCAIASDDVFEYVMCRTKETLDVNPEAIYHDFSEFRSEVLALSLEGKIDIDFDEYHETMRMLSKKYRFTYERRPMGGTE